MLRPSRTMSQRREELESRLKECLDKKMDLEMTIKDLRLELSELTVSGSGESETGGTDSQQGSRTEANQESRYIGSTPEYSLEVSKQVKALATNKDLWSMHRNSPFPATENQHGYCTGAPVVIKWEGEIGYVIGHTATTVDVVTGDIFGPLEGIKVFRKKNRAVMWRNIDLELEKARSGGG